MPYCRDKDSLTDERQAGMDLETMDLETLEYRKDGHIATIILDRPDAGNAFNIKMCEEMFDVWTDFRDDDDMRVAVVSASGDRFFCTGVDVKQATEEAVGDIWLPVARLMDSIHKPMVCAVNGICCGGGLHFIADCDIIIGSENAQFFDPHVNVGFVSGWEPVGLSRRIPLTYLLRMVLQGRNYRIDAEQALRIGLLTEIVPQSQLLARANEIAADVAANAPLAVKYSKQAIKEGLNLGLDKALELSSYIIREVWDTEDFKEGTLAITQRRQPNWQGK